MPSRFIVHNDGSNVRCYVTNESRAPLAVRVATHTVFDAGDEAAVGRAIDRDKNQRAWRLDAKRSYSGELAIGSEHRWSGVHDKPVTIEAGKRILVGVGAGDETRYALATIPAPGQTVELTLDEEDLARCSATARFFLRPKR